MKTRFLKSDIILKVTLLYFNLKLSFDLARRVGMTIM